jgi:hypothetical protein
MELSKARFKPRALYYFRIVEQTGEEIIVTGNGRRSLRITRYRAHERDPLGALRGTVRRYDAPEEPVDAPWDALT